MYAASYGECWSAGCRWFLNTLDFFLGAFDTDDFAMRLWGDVYYVAETRRFVRKPANAEQKRSFVHFILEPLYKLYSQVS